MANNFQIQIDDHSKEFLEALDRGCLDAFEEIGQIAEGYAKADCPVDTGRLRNSITHAQEDDTTEIIGTNVEYAPYVEMGTSRSRAQPYLKPALVNHALEYQRIFQSELGKG